MHDTNHHQKIPYVDKKEEGCCSNFFSLSHHYRLSFLRNKYRQQEHLLRSPEITMISTILSLPVHSRALKARNFELGAISWAPNFDQLSESANLCIFNHPDAFKPPGSMLSTRVTSMKPRWKPVVLQQLSISTAWWGDFAFSAIRKLPSLPGSEWSSEGACFLRISLVWPAILQQTPPLLSGGAWICCCPPVLWCL